MTTTDKIIERGIIFLLIFTPLAFGTVQQWSVAVMEIVAFSIFFLYVIKRILEMPAQCHSNAGSLPDRDSSAGSPPDRDSREGSLPDRDSNAGSLPDCHSREESLPDRDSREESPPDCHSREGGNPFFYDLPRGLTTLFILLAAMIALALFQMVPLPEGLLKLISPASLTTYATFGNAPAGAYHPISINPEATRRELFRVLAYAAIFFVIISHYRTKEQVHSLVKTILAMGCFLVIFALVQKMTWNGRIFWIYPVDEALPMHYIWGPYINRNHFAGYLGMAIPLGMGLLLYSAPRVRALPETALGLKVARFLADEKFVPYALLFLLVLVMTASLFMTFSRGGMIAFVVLSLFFARITWRRRTLRSKTALVFFRMAFRRWRQKHGMFGKCIGAGGLAGFVAIATHSFTDFNLHIPANALLFAVISAITYAALFNVTERGPEITLNFKT